MVVGLNVVCVILFYVSVAACCMAVSCKLSLLHVENNSLFEKEMSVKRVCITSNKLLDIYVSSGSQVKSCE